MNTIVLTEDSYIPTLCIRPSEMNALEYLPKVAKERIFPIFLLSPWVNSKKLENSFDRIKTSFGNQTSFIDIDRTYKIRNNKNAAQIEFLDLLNPKNNYENWIKTITQKENFIPAIQYINTDYDCIKYQADTFSKMGRSFFTRIDINTLSEKDADNIKNLYLKNDYDRITICIDGGLIKNIQLFQSKVISLLRDYFYEIIDESVFIISYTDTPSEYSNFEGVKSRKLKNRDTIQQIKNNLADLTNNAMLLTGDWATARPRDDSAGGGVVIPRIDFPLSDEIAISRNKKDNWNYNEAARKLMESEYWIENGNLNIWGTELIARTSLSQNLGINTPQKNTASRINIHLYRQAFYDTGLPSQEALEEIYED